jgi:hypothetical protein
MSSYNYQKSQLLVCLPQWNFSCRRSCDSAAPTESRLSLLCFSPLLPGPGHQSRRWMAKVTRVDEAFYISQRLHRKHFSTVKAQVLWSIPRISETSGCWRNFLHAAYHTGQRFRIKEFGGLYSVRRVQIVTRLKIAQIEVESHARQ